MALSTTATSCPRSLLAVQALAAFLYAAWIGASAFSAGGHTCFSLFDDSMISMTYARNIAHGEGFTWFPGYAPVEGYTNFLWVMIMAAVHLLPLPDGLTSLPIMLIGAGLLLAQNHLVWRITGHLAAGDERLRSAPVHACLLNAFCYSQLFWTLRGMEVALVSLLLLLAAWEAIQLVDDEGRGSSSRCVAWLVLANLTRPDALIPSGVVVGWLLLRGRTRLGIGSAAAVGATLAAMTLFRLAIFGEALPNTYYLKLEGVPTGFRITEGFLKVLKTIRESLYPIVLLLIVPALMVSPRGVFWRRGSFLLLLGLSMWAYSAYTGGDSWDTQTFANRFLTTGIPPLLCVAGCGPALLGSLPGKWRQPWRTLVILVIVLLPFSLAFETWSFFQTTTLAPYPTFKGFLLGLGPALILSAVLTAFMPRFDHGLWVMRKSARLVAPMAVLSAFLCMNLGSFISVRLGGTSHFSEDARWVRLGIALREATPPETVYAVTWAGAFPYFSHRPCIDMLGKCDPYIARLEPRIAEVGLFPGHMKWDYRHSIGKLKPDVIAGHWYQDNVLEEVLAEGGYVRLSGDWYRRGSSTRVTSEQIMAIVWPDAP